MSDIDIIPNYENGFSLSLGDNSNIVSGNVALLNRFQITFFSEGMFFIGSDDSYIVDNYGGRFMSMLSVPRALSDIQGMTAALTAVINNTVDSIKNATLDTTPDSEKLDKAEIADIFIHNGVVSAIVDIYPVKLELSELPRFYIPITSK